MVNNILIDGEERIGEVTGGSEERAETRRETESGGERREFSGVM